LNSTGYQHSAIIIAMSTSNAIADLTTTGLDKAQSDISAGANNV